MFDICKIFSPFTRRLTTTISPTLCGHSSQDFVPFYVANEYVSRCIELASSIPQYYVLELSKKGNLRDFNFFFYSPCEIDDDEFSFSCLEKALINKQCGKIKTKESTIYLLPHFIRNSSRDILMTCVVNLEKYIRIYIDNDLSEISSKEVAKAIKILISDKLMFDDRYKTFLKVVQTSYLHPLYKEGVKIEMSSSKSIEQTIFASSLEDLPTSLEEQDKLLRKLQLDGQLWRKKTRFSETGQDQ
jgi:hypothetical protein